MNTHLQSWSTRVVFILLFDGIERLLLQHHMEIPNLVSPAAISSSLPVAVTASIRSDRLC